MPLNANYYADPRRPDNSGLGTTKETAEKNFAQAVHFFDRHLNQTLWLADDCYHDIHLPGYDLPGLGAKAHLTIRGYGFGAKPMIDGRNWVTPQNKVLHGIALAVDIGFVYVGPAIDGGHIWSLNMANNPLLGTGGNTPKQVFRVFAGARNNGIFLGQRTIGDALRRIPDRVNGADQLPAQTDVWQYIYDRLTRDAPWYGGAITQDYKLFMWTPTADKNPADYYEGIAFTQSGKGTVGFDGFSFAGAQDIEINGVDVIGSRDAPFNTFANDLVSGSTMPTANIRIINCDTYCTLTGYNLRSQTTAAGIAAGAPYGIKDFLVRGCTGNSNSHDKEQELDKTNYGRLTGASDMFQIRGNMKDCLFEDCISQDSFHTGLTLGGFDAITAKPVACGARNLLVRASNWNSYTRGFGVYMCADSCFIDRMTMDNLNVHSQIVGAPLITSLVGKNARKAERNADDTDGWINIWTIISKGANGADLGLGNNAYFPFEPTNLRIINASLGPCYGTPIKMQSYSDIPAGSPILTPASIKEGTVTFENVVVNDTRPERVNLPSVKTEKFGTAAADIAVVPFRNIAIHKYQEVMPKVSLQTSVTNATVAPGFENVLTVDPVLDENMRPLPGSPLKGAGTQTKLVAALDATGRPFRVKPSIGAFEVS